MSPRKNRRQRTEPTLDPGAARRGIESREPGPDGAWVVRVIAGAAALKTYRCPGCDHEIRPGVGHLVTWPADGLWGPENRRHWHTPCWRARDRRGPVGKRTPRPPRPR